MGEKIDWLRIIKLIRSLKKKGNEYYIFYSYDNNFYQMNIISNLALKILDLMFCVEIVNKHFFLVQSKKTN